MKTICKIFDMLYNCLVKQGSTTKKLLSENKILTINNLQKGRKEMKKFYILIAIGTLAFLASCNQQKSDVTTVTPLDQVGASKDVAPEQPVSQEIPSEPSAAATTTTAPATEQIQQALKNAGLYNGPVDGVLGKKSKAAIMAFQEKNGLTADGKVGKKTWAKLEPYLSTPAAATPAGQ
ncbi:MAG: peptidoglycan-binding domain-containing protein [Candidatus Omnitrophica bacterium]|nr:peptidoglycan-binding domain-containing protein [Candidatus Omnitrophota bacterium]